MPPASTTSSSRRGLLWVILGASLLGFSAIFVKWGMNGGASPLVVGLYRMLFALPGILLLVQRDGAGFGDRRATAWALLAGAAFAGDLSFWHQSMRYTSAANSTFIVCGLSPVWVALFSVGVYRVRYRWLGWLGQLMGVSGAMVLAMARGARVGSGRGEILAICASLCYAGFSLALARARRRNTAQQSLLWMSVGSLLTFVLLELAERQPLVGFTAHAWFGLFGLGVVVQLLAWLMINNGIAHVPIALGALALGSQQVATPFLAAWLLDEPLRPLGLVGGSIIMVGIYLVATGVRSPRRSKPA
jgi:drug/metabolite transporter (DMT)-like permease